MAVFRANIYFLAGVLPLFLLFGLAYSLTLPFFQGPDEQVHYATIQHRAEPEEKNWPISQAPSQQINNIRTYSFSEEVTKTAENLQFDEVKWQKENSQSFSSGKNGFTEEEIIANNWKRYIDLEPKNASGTSSLYYTAGTLIERQFSEYSILTRFLSLRFFSLSLGLLVVLLAYLTAQKINFSERASALFAGLVAFQPMFLMLATNVNIDIILYFSFSLFVYAAVRLLKSGLKLSSCLLLLTSLILGFYSKGPGIVLTIIAIPLFIFLLASRFSLTTRQLIWSILGSFFVLLLGTILLPSEYMADITNRGTQSAFSSPFTSLATYTDKTLDGDAFRRTHASYWGHFGWLDTQISDPVLDALWILKIAALLGLIFFLWSKKIRDYLPEKKYVFFALGILLVLQLAIRFHDWRVFDATEKIIIGTPGRYFLPNIIPHMLLLITGLGYFTKNKEQFHLLLKILALLVLLLSLYSLINVIIPRYYL